MKSSIARNLTFGLALSLSLSPVAAQAEPAKSVEALLKRVKQVVGEQESTDDKRMNQFRADRNEQRRLLAEQKRRLADLEKRSRQLEAQFEKNEKQVEELDAELKDKQGTRGELFGVARQVAGDVRALLLESLVSAEHPGRAEELDELAEAEDVPSIDQLQQLWLAMQEEIVWSGQVSRFQADVVELDGQTVASEVVRMGPFTAGSKGKFVVWTSADQVLVELGRQPGERYMGALSDVSSSFDGFQVAPMDPSRGSILSLLVETPTFLERLSYGGAIGYIVIGLGIAAFLFGIVKLIQLILARAKVGAQLRSSEIKTNNPLGRLLALSRGGAGLDTETFEARLDEGVIRESARLESGIWIVRVIAVAAPLMGLLGTVTGMINTFQAITLFGTGDPKLMAGGISEALVTTMLGLMTAIPLVLLGNLLGNMCQRIIDVLDEQAAGMVADRLSRAPAESHNHGSDLV